MADLIGELGRRNVFRVAVVYLIAGWLILQISDIVFPGLGLPEWTITFVIALLGIGFPVAVILAWAFELTPEGVKREKDVDRTESITPSTGKRIDKVIIALLVVAVAYLAVDKFVLRPETDTVASETREGLRSIAVLPLANMSQNPENEYFSDGLADTLLHMLAQVKDLRVAARTSSFAFKGQNKDVRSIGEELGVETVLEGSVQRSADRVRITVQLINTQDGYHLWSETYDRDLDDIFAVQDEIAAAIANALQVTLGTAEQEAIAARGTNNLGAFELYLLGRHDWASRSFERLHRAREYFQEAVEKDPEFAMAWAGLADTYLVLPWYDKDAKTEEVIPLARAAAERALELEPRLGEAYASLGVIAHEYDWDWEKSEQYFRKAAELNPNHATTWHWYCNLNQTLGRLEEAAEACEKAVKLDPLSPIINLNYASVFADAGDLARGVEIMEHTVALDPEWVVGLNNLVAYYVLSERYEDAADTFERWAQLTRHSDPAQARKVIAGIQDPVLRDAALGALNRMVDEGRRNVLMNFAQFYPWLKDNDTFFAIVDEAIKENHPGIVFLGNSACYDAARDDPRMVALTEELGLPNGVGPVHQRNRGQGP